MANEKIFNTRVQLKNDIEANWVKAVNFSPLPGEIIIYNAEIEGDDEQLPRDLETQQELRDYWITYPRIKIGNGVTNVNNLPFINTQVQIITWEADD